MGADGRTILVVEDSPDERSYLASVLGDAGYTVVEAVDGAEAVEKLEADKPDLVTLDVTMPEKSGVAVYRRLKEHDDLKDVPVVIVTGISADFKKFISTRRQVPPPEGYIAKPVDFEELLGMVGGLLG